MDTLVLVATTIALIWKVVDGIKLLVPNIPPFLVQVLAWIVGIGVAFLLKASDLASGIEAGPLNLDQVGFWTTVIFGFALGSTASAAKDTNKAIDNSQTAIPGATVTH